MIAPGVARKLARESAVSGRFPMRNMASQELNELMKKYSVDNDVLARVLGYSPITIKGWRYRGTVSPLIAPVLDQFFMARASGQEFRVPDYFDQIKVEGVGGKRKPKRRKGVARRQTQPVKATHPFTAVAAPNGHTAPGAPMVRKEVLIPTDPRLQVREVLMEASAKLTQLAVQLADRKGPNPDKTLATVSQCMHLSQALQDDEAIDHLLQQH